MNKLTIFISSCDAFSDCWEPYCHGLRKYWPDRPYEVLIVSNFKDFDNGIARAIKVGEDKGWSENTTRALREVKTPYIFYTHEDFWIKKAVDTRVIEEYVSLMESGKADYIRLFPAPPPDRDFPDDQRLGILLDEAPYRTSLQVALWRKSVMEALIVAGENPWHFELRGPARSRKYGSRFLCVKRFYDQEKQPYHYGVDYVCTAINKGRWSKAAKEYAQAEGLVVDFSNRPSENWWDDFTRSGRIGAFCGKAVHYSFQTVTNPNKAVKAIQMRLKKVYRSGA